MRIRHIASTSLLLVSLVLVSFGASAATVGAAVSSSGCCNGLRGNVDGQGIVELLDLSALVSYLTGGSYVPPCLEQANVDGKGIIELVDLSMLISYLTGGPVTLIPCSADTSYISDTLRVASLQAVRQEINLVSDLPIDSFNQQMLTYLQSRPEFAEAGKSSSAGNVWARFTDGILLFISNSFGRSLDTLPGDPLPPDSAAAPGLVPGINSPKQTRGSHNRTALGTEDDLPKSVGYRVVSPLGDLYPAASTTASRLKSWLKSGGYAQESPLISVYEMRKVGGDGLFCYFGHGAMGKTISSDTNAFEYGIWTSNTSDNQDSIAQFRDDFLARRLCYFFLPNSVDPVTHRAVWAEQIGITSKFISYYWKPFSPNAVVIINACGSDAAPAFRNAILSKGGPAYFGWSSTVSCKGSCYATEYLIDRLLGANKAYPQENPKQRPFPVGDVYGDMKANGIYIQPNGDTSAVGTSTLQYHPGSSNFGLLSPTISFMAVEEELGEQLYINGIFGADPAEDGRVMIGGTPLVVTSWQPNEIRCDLPRDGAGSEGPVTVEVRGDFGGTTPLDYRKSNVVNLTSWRIPFHYAYDEGGAKVDVDMNLHIRADIHAHREVIHEPPVNLVGVPFHHALDSQGSFAASGSGTACDADCCWTDTWSGSGDLAVPEIAIGAATFLANGGVDPAHHTFTMVIGAGVDEGIDTKHCSSCYPPSNPCDYGTLGWRSDISICEGFNPEPYFTMYLNNNFDVLPGERVPTGLVPPTTYIYLFSGVPTIKLSWPATAASFPPDDQAAR